MATTLRVHILAKELGVPSKAIIEKCKAEGIELRNHMATISVGLAESIREWFSDAEDVTSVEEAERVDVVQVRSARRKAEPPPPEPVETPAAAEVSAAEAPPVTTASSEAPPGEPAVPAEEAERELAASALAAEAAAVGVEPAPPAPHMAPAPPEAAEPPAPATVITVTEVPALSEEAPAMRPAASAERAPHAPAVGPPPPPIRPAGPQVVPAPAALRGPTLVRIESPEPTIPPRARSVSRFATGERGPAPVAAPGARRDKRGRRVEDEEAAARSRSPRRHGGAASPDPEQQLREWRDQDLIERRERLASVTGHGLRDRRAAERRRQATSQGSTAQVRRDPVAITAPIGIKDFCAAIGQSFAVISKKLIEHTGRLWTINQSLEADLVELVAMDVGVPVIVQKAKTAYELLEEEFTSRVRKHSLPRPPVVAMLGHVDHGKTSLLDAIRATQVAAGEAGGITQHIGAYRVRRGAWDVTFVDTPGHQAFTAMRARGAHLTDVVVLIVAADDGVMPQTIEAIAHARAAKVPIVVALNKIDLPGIDLNRVYAQLSEQGLTPAEWGGETDVIKTSATKGVGIDELLTHLSTLTELLELRADPTLPAYGTVIEAQMREGRGFVANVLIHEGTLRPGQVVVCGPGAGRVRALRDALAQTVDEATPGTPVEVSGLDELPAAGDRLFQVESLARAKEIAHEVQQSRREAAIASAAKSRTLEDLLRGSAEAELPELNVIVKADVQGSVEVIRKSLAEIPGTKAKLNLLHAGVGAISEADVQLAKASRALLIGFHVVAEDRARQLADQLGVEIRAYRVIYEMLEELRAALAGLLEPLKKEEVRATIDVRQVFNVSRVGTVAGCLVKDGSVHRNHKLRLIRDGRIVTENRAIASLRRFKDDVREVRAGMECGIKLEDFDDVKPNDVLQAYELVEVAADLN